jgi:hypothetical protein
MAVRVALLSFVIAVNNTASLADAMKPEPAQACAAFDLHVLTLLEDYSQSATTGYALASVMSQLIDARVACRLGDYDRALDRYSRIDLQQPIPNASADVVEVR